ncbi:MAG: PD-(D/E)XK nuclease family transposase [Clostridia bacterium]|nr:PD-(D/E)XK nuclease family transposase [Clostridia bacterium]
MTEKERIRQEFLRQRVQDLCLMDDVFMTKVFGESPACTQLVLRIILGIEDLVVERVQVQYSLQNMHKRSVRLDVLATDKSGKKYNIEIQRDSRGAGARRARYNSSLIDADMTLPGDDFNSLAEVYVIFITEKDYFGDGLPLYTIERTIRENSRAFGDGSYIIYVNGENRDDTQLGQLMHDFFCSKPAEMVYKELADEARYWKEDAKGANIMSESLRAMFLELMADECAEARAEGVAAGTAEGKIEGIEIGVKLLIEAMAKSGKYSAQEIADLYKLGETDVLHRSDSAQN